MQKQYDICRDMVEAKLETYFSGSPAQKSLYEAMRYSLLAGGKRIRPVIVLKFCELSGGDMNKALPFACAVEMLHTYSLIHDDLPCMDNDDLRRGKPTNHVVYGECLATLAGDALQAAAFETLLSADLEAEKIVAAARELAFAAGEDGMCGGQVLDMDGEKRELALSEVEKIHELKTAAMIKAAARIGVIAGGGNEAQFKAADEYAEKIGLAFQVRDDILDCISTKEELGKTIGSDEENGKTTFVTLFGIEKCEEIVNGKTAEAKAALASAFENTAFFDWLADLLAGRKS